MLQLKPDKEAFERVCQSLEKGEWLTLKHVADVFGWPFVELLIVAIVDEKGNTDIEVLLGDIKIILRRMEAKKMEPPL